jgi:hypothetical protein
MLLERFGFAAPSHFDSLTEEFLLRPRKFSGEVPELDVVEYDSDNETSEDDDDDDSDDDSDDPHTSGWADDDSEDGTGHLVDSDMSDEEVESEELSEMWSDSMPSLE